MRTKQQSSQHKMSRAGGDVDYTRRNHVVKLLPESLCAALNRIPAGIREAIERIP